MDFEQKNFVIPNNAVKRLILPQWKGVRWRASAKFVNTNFKWQSNYSACHEPEDGEKSVEGAVTG